MLCNISLFDPNLDMASPPGFSEEARQGFGTKTPPRCPNPVWGRKSACCSGRRWPLSALKRASWANFGFRSTRRSGDLTKNFYS